MFFKNNSLEIRSFLKCLYSYFYQLSMKHFSSLSVFKFNVIVFKHNINFVNKLIKRFCYYSLIYKKGYNNVHTYLVIKVMKKANCFRC